MPQTDQLQSPSPFRLGFRPPSNPDDLQSSPPLPSPGTSPESLEDLSLDEPAPGSDEWAPDLSDESPDGTSSPGSTREPDSKVDLLTEDEAIALAQAGVATAGQKAHDMFAVTPGQQHVGLYLTDEQDQANIGTPLGKIAARHQGIGGKVNPDTKDLLSALVGLAGYATKQINLRTQARGLDAGAGHLAGNPQPMPQAVDL